MLATLLLVPVAATAFVLAPAGPARRPSRSALRGWLDNAEEWAASILPKPEDMGMKRFDVTTFPEQYPATLERWADAVPGDAGPAALVRPMLAQTLLEDRKLRVAYDASKDGWTAAAFHAKCDRLGGAVVLVETAGGEWGAAVSRPARLTLPKGAVCGGYNPKGTVGFGEFRGSLAAFLFTWPDGDVSVRPTKLQKVGGAGLACVDEPEHGPKFGADSLVIPLSSEGGNNPTAARNKQARHLLRPPAGRRWVDFRAGRADGDDAHVAQSAGRGVRAGGGDPEQRRAAVRVELSVKQK